MEIILKFASWKELEEFRKPVDVKAPAPAAVDPAPAEKKEEAPAKKETEKKPTVDPTALKILAADLAKAGHRKELKDLLTEFGEKSVTDLIAHQPEKLSGFKERLEALNAG